MEHHAAESLAHQMLDRHGLTAAGWTFAFDRATKRLGACHYGRCQITLSRVITANSDEEQVHQTLLHEVAHALLPVQRRDGTHIGHGPEWKRLSRQLGYAGERTLGGTAAAVRRPAGLRLGDLVSSIDGRTGRVTKLGRTRVRFRDYEGLTWAVHFANVTVVVPGCRA